MTTVLSVQDVALIMLLHRYRYLTSSQLARASRRSGQNVRRAMRTRLVPAGFVVRMQGNRNEEVAYCLGKLGFSFVAEELGCAVSDLPFSQKVRTTRSFFWRHTVLTNTLRLAFDLSTSAPDSPVRIRRTIPEWEMAPGAAGRRKLPHHHRFVLSERLEAADGTLHSYRPDCLFLMHPTLAEHQLVAMMSECDRGTETMRCIRSKYSAYWLYFRRQRYIHAYQAVTMRVLFLLDGGPRDDRRIRSMQAELAKFVATRAPFEVQRRDAMCTIRPEDFAACFRFARARDLDDPHAMTTPMWHSSQPDEALRPLFRQPVRVPAEAAE